jgi:hypothetical protein
MADQFGNLSPEDFAQQQAINRQQRLASMLMQNTAQPQGQMVSGRYVAPSFFQNITPLVNAYFGKELQEKGDTQQLQLAEAIRSRGNQDLQEMLQTARGTPAQQAGIYGQDGQRTQATTADMYDANLQLNPQYQQKEAIAGQAPNPMAAILKGSSSYNPMARQYAGTLLAQMTKEPEAFNLNEGEVRYVMNPDGTTRKIAEGKEKTEKQPVSYQEYLLAQNDPIKPFKGSYNEYQDYEANRRRPVTNITTNVVGEQKTFENTQKLRSMFGQEPIYKAFQEVKSAYKQVEDGLKMESPAGDLAAATKFMKLLDPGSVVRESELALAMQAGGALDRLQNYATKVMQGTKLTPLQRKDFSDLSKQFYNSSATQFNSKQKEYVDIAERYRFNPADVAGAPIEMIGSEPKYIVNPQTKERRVSTDGGKTWTPVK